MKAISLWQPWASLIACGAKPFETRSWAPPRELIGATIAIHAAKKIDKGAAQFATDLMYGQHKPGGYDLAEKLEVTMQDTPDSLMGIFGHTFMPIGCIVCTARLVAAFQLGEAGRIVRRLTSSLEQQGLTEIPVDDFGDYAPGRWAWLMRDAKPLIPHPRAIGHQGFFDLPQGWLT